MICSQDRDSSRMAFCEGREALIGWIARPVSVFSRPIVSSEVVSAILLASRMPSEVKYHNSTYSMAATLSIANGSGEYGILAEMVRSGLKLGNVVLFLGGCGMSGEGLLSGGAMGERGAGGARGAGGIGGVRGSWSPMPFHIACNLWMASSFEQLKRSMRVALVASKASVSHWGGLLSAIMEENYSGSPLFTAGRSKVEWRYAEIMEYLK